MPLSLDSGVTSSSFDCPVPSSLEERGCMDGHTSGRVAALGTETGKTWGSLSLWPLTLALSRCFFFPGASSAAAKC